MENQKQRNDFVISIAGANIDITIVNIEEMSGYCKARNRLANVVTQKQTYGELEKSNYSLIMNYTKPKPRVINTKDKQYLNVYNVLSEKYKRGLLICEGDTLSDAISDLLCKSDSWQNNDVDIMICRDSFSLVTMDEFKKANYLRISADPALDASIFIKLQDYFQEKTMALMISQYFVNDQYDSVIAYMNKATEHYTKQGITDYIDYYELNKQLAFFVYFDIAANKIINLSKETLIAFIRKMSKQGILPIPDAQIEPYVDIIAV